MKTTVYATVFGAGEFPYDMLRYDTCWPAREIYSPELAATGTRAVVVATEWEGRKTDLRSQGPVLAFTPGRWASFGWQIIGCTVELHEAEEFAKGVRA